VRPPTKTAVLEVINRRKNAKEVKAEHLLFVAFVIFQKIK